MDKNKERVCGVFPGGDPRTFDQVADLCTPEQINLYRVACEHWNQAEAEGRILSGLDAEHVPDNATQGDYDALNFGRGLFEIEKAASEPKPPAELDAVDKDVPVRPLKDVQG